MFSLDRRRGSWDVKRRTLANIAEFEQKIAGREPSMPPGGGMGMDY
jgi:hypothetical protein